MHPNPSAIRSLTQAIRAEAARHHKAVLCLTVSSIHTVVSHGKSGTCACLAGWNALAQTRPEMILITPEAALDRQTLIPLGYQTGAAQFASQLGYDSVFGLLGWATAHPQLWGNPHGEYLFSSFKAYGLTYLDSDCEQPIGLLLDYWNGVADRIQAAAAKPSPPTRKGQHD